MMYEEEFAKRLYELRTAKGVSAREMSLSIGQNPGYIHNIESGKALPSMAAFFFICDFLKISPKDFFDTDNPAPELLANMLHDLEYLDREQIDHIAVIIKDLRK